MRKMQQQQQQLRQSSVVVVVVVVLLSLLATGCTGSDPLAGPVFQSRRVSKSTASVEPQQLLQSPSPIASASREHLKGRTLGGAQGPRTTTVAAAIRQRFEQTVQQVKSRTKELRMEQEQKRVDRKLRRDQQKQERAAATATATGKPAAKSQTLKLTFEPVNPHNLQMPDCGTEGKVYNGRRCVLMSKMSKKPKH
ncbi:hypothetical protein AND_003804 [Anopheles darlingi]|uniref:Secreted protein n=1 Tax=Anopheles darlingi TaxID=43151 RepID=W5JMC8_ANODA|nr:hypothetical protein AND_003804 [Anopheles darlingi]